MPEGGADLVGLVRGATAEEVVEALASWPGGVNGLSMDGESPVVACAEVGRVALLKSLVAANASPVAASTWGLSALAAAAMTGNLECVRVLLDAGAAPDQPCGSMQVTPLSYAAQEGYRGVVEALIDAGADAMRSDSYGFTPVDYAARRTAENQVRNFNFHT
jgi:serine/threonine-protein phosphatase 6 regulatory ankyrin repeat subunit B